MFKDLVETDFGYITQSASYLLMRKVSLPPLPDLFMIFIIENIISHHAYMQTTSKLFGFPF